MKKYIIPALASLMLCSVSHFALASSESGGTAAAPSIAAGEPHPGGMGEHRGRMKEKLENMSPEEKEKFKAHMEERKAKWDAMSPEEKEAHMKMKQERREKWESMSPEEKEKFKAHMEERKAKWDAMSPEEKEAFKKKREERREKWQAMSPEERQAAKEKWKGHRQGMGSGGGEPPAAPPAN